MPDGCILADLGGWARGCFTLVTRQVGVDTTQGFASRGGCSVKVVLCFVGFYSYVVDVVSCAFLSPAAKQNWQILFACTHPSAWYSPAG